MRARAPMVLGPAGSLAAGAMASAATATHRCAILDGQARCDITIRSWKPPARPASCPHVVGKLRCESATTGLRCRSTRTGHGFFISRQRYSLF